MEPFLIIICVSLAVNFLFVLGAVIYTIIKKDKLPSEDPRVSTASTTMPPSWESRTRRHSSHPQVVLYHSFVRMSLATAQSKKTFWRKFGCGSSV